MTNILDPTRYNIPQEAIAKARETGTLTFTVPLAEQPPVGYEFEDISDLEMHFRRSDREIFEPNWITRLPIPIGEYAVAEEWCCALGGSPWLWRDYLAFHEIKNEMLKERRQISVTKYEAATMPAELAPHCNVLRNMSVTGVQGECGCFHGIKNWAGPRETVCPRCNGTGKLHAAEYRCDMEEA